MYDEPLLGSDGINRPRPAWLTQTPSQDELKKVINSAKLKFIDGPDDDPQYQYFVYITIDSKLVTKNHFRDGGRISGFCYWVNVVNNDVKVNLSNIDVDRPD